MCRWIGSASVCLVVSNISLSVDTRAQAKVNAFTRAGSGERKPRRNKKHKTARVTLICLRHRFQ